MLNTHHVVKRTFKNSSDTFEHTFGSYDEALQFANNCNADIAEIYDNIGELVFAVTQNNPTKFI